MMKQRGHRIARNLIDIYELHRQGVPVDISPLEHAFPLDLQDLSGSGVMAFVVPARGRRAARVVIDQGCPRRQRRWLYAHEVAHAALGHDGSLSVLKVDDWFHDRAEREAWHLAAELLVPDDIIFRRGNWTEAEIAALCEVPVELVQLHPGLKV
jgi:hypothetical protein